MRYEQAKPLLDTLIELAYLYHGNKDLMRQRMYAALDDYLPNMDEGCRTRGCIAVDDFKEKKDE